MWAVDIVFITSCQRKRGRKTTQTIKWVQEQFLKPDKNNQLVLKKKNKREKTINQALFKA